MNGKIKQKRVEVLEKIISRLKIRKPFGWQKLVEFHKQTVVRLKKDGNM